MPERSSVVRNGQVSDLKLHGDKTQLSQHERNTHTVGNK